MIILYYSDEFSCHNNTHVRSLRRSNFVRSKFTVTTVRYIIVLLFSLGRYVNKRICCTLLYTFFLLRARHQHLCALYALNFNVFNYCLSLLISLIMVYCFLIVHQVFDFVEPVNTTVPH